MNDNITLRNCRKEDAPAVASLIIEAMSEECCQHFYGKSHTIEEFHDMIARLVEREHTQYSYENTICAVNGTGRVVGIMICYDGRQLKELRRAFIDETKKRFDRDFSDMPDETEAGELYVDSAAVVRDMRRQGIAKQLFKAAGNRAISMGINRLGLLVDRNNPNAERLYRSLGFEYVGDTDWGGHTLKHMQLNTEQG